MVTIVESIGKREVHTPAALRQAVQDNAPVFDLDDLPSLALADISPVEFLVDGLIVKSAVGMITGPAGSGKSTVVLSMADAIANGKPWCGFQTKQANVLYLDRENPETIAKERLNRMGIVDTGTLKIWSLWHREPDIFNHELMSPIVAKYVEKHPGCMIIVDSLIGYLPDGASENDASHIRPFMNQACKLAAMEA